MPQPLGLYIHIPFCKARCGYCDFVTFAGRETEIDSYVDNLCHEIALYQTHNLLPNQSISTVFFGGGTPSLLEDVHVHKVLDQIRSKWLLSPEIEITLEANPESISATKAQAWRKAGVNRLSIGLQAMDDALLIRMGRLHTAQGFRDAYAAVRSQGFDNVNVDLIYGFPGQSLVSWQETVSATIDLGPEHISAYSLTVEPNTPFAAEGLVADPDMQGDMYAWSRQTFAKAGYGQYEVSNFCLPKKECAHNLLYWRQNAYLGLGVGAVGCQNGLRWQNVKSLSAYQEALNDNRLPRQSEERLDDQILRFERLMLGLRLREGMVWPDEPNAQWASRREELLRSGWLERLSEDRWRISDPFVPFTNQILLQFL